MLLNNTFRYLLDGYIRSMVQLTGINQILDS